MNRWFNILPEGADSCKILIYGFIGQWEDEVTSKGFVTELVQAEAAYRKINVHINSNGGDVFEGLAIFNALRNSTADITIYIDGIAASMASVIAMCGKPVYMNRYSRLMIHSVTAGSYGNAGQMEEAARMIRDVESILVDVFATKTGMSATEVKDRWFDGNDHWLTADEALEAKLIDGVFDGVKVDPARAGEAKNLMEMFNVLLTKNDYQMKNLLKKLGFKSEATEEEVIEKIDELEAEAEAKAKEKAKAEAEAKDAEIENLKSKLKAFEEAEAKAKEAEIGAILKNAVDAGKIQEPQKPHFKAILEKDFENGKAILDSMRPGKRLKDEIGKDGKSQFESYTFSDYQKKAPKALAEMKASDPNRFSELYEMEFGHKPKIQ